MIFSNEQEIKAILEKNKKLPEWVDKAREYHKDWKALYYGEDYKEKIIRIEHIESIKRQQARKKYSRPIKDSIQKLVRPIDAVYSAVGGSKIYNKELSDTQQGDFLKHISKIRENKSVEKWLETYWAKDLYIVDPSGLIFMEYMSDEWIKPTYKSILSIRNYESKGQKLEWVVFEPEKINNNGSVYYKWRVVDDKKDYTFKQDGDNFSIIKEETFEHPFGKVPGIINSDKTRMGKEGKLSPFDDIKEGLEELMRDQSILTIYKFMNGFVVPYMAEVLCTECNGSGKIDHQKCGTCDGSGKMFNNDVTDRIVLPISLNTTDEIRVPENPGGFITPDMEIWDKYEETIDKHVMSFYDALWGITIEKDQSQTATEIMVNAQPKINKLNEWSDVAQYMEHEVTEFIANWKFPTKDKEKKVSQINYGRVYLIRTSEQIMSDLENAIKEGLPDSMKSKLYLEYITTKYKNDPETLYEELKKSELEYWPFYSIDDVSKIMGTEAAQKKMMFTDWWEQLTEKDKQMDTRKLEKKRDEWIKNILTQKQEQNGNIGIPAGETGQGR